MKILVAEDDLAVQDTMDFLMEVWGYEADVAPNGFEAVQRAGRKQYDLCIMDIDMPVMNGLEATCEIRNRLSYHLPILGYSGNIQEYQRECLEIGMDDVIAKPADIDLLYKKIQELDVKIITVYEEQNQIKFIKEMAVSKDQFEKIRRLEKEGLTIFRLRGINDEFITHSNIQNKISYDFAKGQILSEFLDRSPDRPGKVHIYQFNLHANQTDLSPEEFETQKKDEDELMEKFKQPTVMPVKEDEK